MNKYIATFIVCFWAVIACGQDGYVTVKQDGTGDFTTIQAALDDIGSNPTGVIMVYPGQYKENIVIDEVNPQGIVKLKAYEGPYLTCIDGIEHSEDVVINIDTGSLAVQNVEIVGFTVKNGDRGIEVGNSSHVTIANCVAFQNITHGFYSTWTSGTATYLALRNCVSIFNGDSGYYMKARTGSYDSRYIHAGGIFNCVMAWNTYAIRFNNDSGTFHSDNNFSIDSILIYVNPYGTDVGPGRDLGVANEIGNQVTDPLFIGVDGGEILPGGLGVDVRLAADSLCKDAGRPGDIDPDGTPNDLGAYGGPYAQSFFESPTDGPIVREVRVTPGSVPRGEEITIEATVAVR